MGFHMIQEPDAALKLALEQSGMTFIPWIRQSAVLYRDISKDDWVKDPPYECDVAKLTKEIAELIPEDAPFAYLDIETPMSQPFSARSLAVYQDAIGVARNARLRTKWGIYSMVHKPLTWRNPGVPWSHWRNGIYPLCSFGCPSLYPRSGKWTYDLNERWKIDTAVFDTILSDEGEFPQLAFVRPRWASNGGDGQFVPLDWFKFWLDTLERRGIAVCLFMNGTEQSDMVEEFVPYMKAVGAMEKTP